MSTPPLLRCDTRGISILFAAGGEINHIGLVSSPNDDTQVRSHGLLTREHQQANTDTIICTWYNPSKVVWLHYGDPKSAKHACDRLTTKIHTRMIKPELVPPNPQISSTNPVWTVRLANVHPRTDKREILSHLKYIPPLNVLHNPPTIDKTDDETIEAIFTGLNHFGRQVRSFDVIALPWKGQLRAFVTFSSQIDVESALQLHNRHIASIGSRVFVERKVTARISLLSTVYYAIKADMSALNFDNTDEQLDRIRIIAAAGKTFSFMSIWIVGSTTLSVTKAMIQVQLLTRGMVLLNHRGGPLWDEFYASDAGSAEIQGHNKHGLLFLYRDLSTRRILAYGRKDQVMSARGSLMDGIRSRSGNLHLIRMDSGLTQEAKEYGLLHLRSKFGQPLVPVPDRQNDCCIPFNGSNQDAEYAQKFLTDLAASPGNPTNPSRRDACPICLNRIKDSIRLSCGHQVCRACLEAQCRVADVHGLPIRCFGAQQTCLKPVLIQDLSKYMPGAILDRLLGRSLDVYLRNYWDRLQQCVTTGCPNIFLVTDPARPHVCSRCLISICTRCKTLSHEGINCQENTRLICREQKYESLEAIPTVTIQLADLVLGRRLPSSSHEPSYRVF